MANQLEEEPIQAAHQRALDDELNEPADTRNEAAYHQASIHHDHRADRDPKISFHEFPGATQTTADVDVVITLANRGEKRVWIERRTRQADGRAAGRGAFAQFLQEDRLARRADPGGAVLDGVVPGEQLAALGTDDFTGGGDSA